MPHGATRNWNARYVTVFVYTRFCTNDSYTTMHKYLDISYNFIEGIDLRYRLLSHFSSYDQRTKKNFTLFVCWCVINKYCHFNKNQFFKRECNCCLQSKLMITIIKKTGLVGRWDWLNRIKVSPRIFFFCSCACERSIARQYKPKKMAFNLFENLCCDAIRQRLWLMINELLDPAPRGKCAAYMKYEGKYLPRAVYF